MYQFKKISRDDVGQAFFDMLSLPDVWRMADLRRAERATVRRQLQANAIRNWEDAAAAMDDDDGAAYDA